MSLAWAPVAIIFLLLPGIFFFIGLATYERLSREIIRSGVVSEVAMAASIAVGIHTVMLLILSAVFGFRLSRFLGPFAVYTTAESVPPEAAAVFVIYAFTKLVPTVLYLAACTAAGFGLGYAVAIGIVSGHLRQLVSHKWIYDIIDADR